MYHLTVRSNSKSLPHICDVEEFDIIFCIFIYGVMNVNILIYILFESLRNHDYLYTQHCFHTGFVTAIPIAISQTENKGIQRNL